MILKYKKIKFLENVFTAFPNTALLNLVKRFLR